nr:oligopeptide:H+ symporter [Streptomyces bicolor]
MSAGTAVSVSAASIPAAYGTLVYLVSVAGGHYAMAVPTALMTWVGLGLISAGTGLLKPSAATVVGKLYRTDDERRDADFALFSMAINIGAFAGPLVTGWLGDHKGRHRGFSAAAIGMTFGLAQYVVGRRHLAGRKHAAEFALAPDAMRRAIHLIASGLVTATALAVLLVAAGRLTMGRFVDLLTLVSVIAPVAYFAVMFAGPGVAPEERGRLRPYIVLFLASTAFNSVLFQAYSTMMLPASTNAEKTILGFDFPASWYACAVGAFEVALAPVVAALWVRMGHSRPHASDKIAIGAVLSGLSFLLMALPTAGHSTDDDLMSVWWIVGSHLLLGLGDILLETSGTSATTNQTVKLYDDVSKPACFGINGAIAVSAGPAVMAAAPWLRRTMHPVH